jgi:serine O-acetyltransferase
VSGPLAQASVRYPTEARGGSDEDGAMDGSPAAPAMPAARTPAALRADYTRYLHVARAQHAGLRAHLSATAQFGFLAIAVYRYGRWTRRVRPRALALPFKLVYRLLELAVRILFGIELSSNCDIGPGFYIGHAFGIVVHGDLGARCSIGQGVTIGAKGAGRSRGYPVLGDDVYLGAGAMVIGDVRIGDRVVVGANTVVVQDVPSDCRVVSAPVRILPAR